MRGLDIKLDPPAVGKRDRDRTPEALDPDRRKRLRNHAEALATAKVLTIGRQDFQTYRVRRGHRPAKVEIIE